MFGETDHKGRLLRRSPLWKQPYPVSRPPPPQLITSTTPPPHPIPLETVALPPLISIKGPLCQPDPWIRRFAAGVARHTNPAIVHVVTNSVSSAVTDAFIL